MVKYWYRGEHAVVQSWFVKDYAETLVARTLDGAPVYSVSFTDLFHQAKIRYLVVIINGERRYVYGSGEEIDLNDTNNVLRWDSKSITLEVIEKSMAISLIRFFHC